MTNTGTSESFASPSPGRMPSTACSTRGRRTTWSDGDGGRRSAPGERVVRVSPAPKRRPARDFTYTGSATRTARLTSWQWDLDGDGSFETTTPTGVATNDLRRARDRQRPHARGRRQRRGVGGRHAGRDDRRGGLAGAAPAARGNSGNKDTTAPQATLVKLTGLKLDLPQLRARERDCHAARAWQDRSRRAAPRPSRARSACACKLTSAGRSMLARGHKLKATLTLTLRDASGNRRALKKTLTVRRP